MPMCRRSCFSSFEKFRLPLPSSCTPIRNRTPLRSLGFLPIMSFRSSSNEFHFLSWLRSRLNMLQFLPVFERPAQMGNDDRTADQSCHTHGFIHFICRKPYFLAFTKMVSYTVVAAKYERTGEADEFL